MTTLSTDHRGPFTHAPNSIQKTMVTVVVALMPATILDLVLFGWPAIFLFIVTIGSCLLIEAACVQLQGRPALPVVFDGSALLTGWLLAMSLPPWAPWWIGVLGAVFAVALAKQVFGGLGQNVFNPAMVARVALLVSFPVPMTAFVAPHPLFTEGAPDFLTALTITFGGGFSLDTMSAASALGYVKTELSRGIPVSESVDHVAGWLEMISGYRTGSFGETSALLILGGGLFLIWRKIISWHIPVAVIGTLFAMATLFHTLNPERFTDGFFHLFAGATFLGAFFIATDYVTSPGSASGKLVYGFGVGLLTWIIRSFAGYPEGMAFAVLLMNFATDVVQQVTSLNLEVLGACGGRLPARAEKLARDAVIWTHLAGDSIQRMKAVRRMKWS